jgi:DNA ligase-1
MLASHCTDTSKLVFPVLASKKLDGIRATVQDGRLLSRSLKPIANENVQARFANLSEGLDGELIVGNPCAGDAYRKTSSVVMSDDKPSVDVRYYVFDKYDETAGFGTRIAEACMAVDHAHDASVIYVRHTRIECIEELDEYEAAALAERNEGVMVRSITGPYKQGRSSEREAYLLKLKRFCDLEARVIGVEEQMHNDNPAFTNEVGRTARSSAKAGKVGAGVMGKLNAEGICGDFAGVRFDVGTGFDAGERQELWDNPPIGRIVKVKYFPSGGKSLPRHPVYIGWRDERDLS